MALIIEFNNDIRDDKTSKLVSKYPLGYDNTKKNMPILRAQLMSDHRP
jgi:hypothetical protein